MHAKTAKIFEVFSRITPNQVTHRFYCSNESLVVSVDSQVQTRTLGFSQRLDLNEPEFGLQIAYLELKAGDTFHPHVHEFQNLPERFSNTIESWFVVRGAVRMFLYDIDGALLGECELSSGDLAITLSGGHNYLSKEKDTIVLEFKSGPYNPSYDKRRI